MYRDTTNVDHEVYERTGDNWSRRNRDKILKKNSGTTPGKHSVYLLQKAATFGTSQIIREILQAEI